MIFKMLSETNEDIDLFLLVLSYYLYKCMDSWYGEIDHP